MCRQELDLKGSFVLLGNIARRSADAEHLSGLAILLYAAHIVTMVYSITFLAPLTALLFVALLVHAGRGREEVLLNRLWGGLTAGLVGLIAYDLVRLVVPGHRGDRGRHRRTAGEHGGAPGRQQHAAR